MAFRRPPLPALRPFVSLLWATPEVDDSRSMPFARERVLPTGAMHLVFRLSNEPLCVFATPDAPVARRMGHTLVGGARCRAYIRDISNPSCSVGAMLEPGAAQVLFGVPATELADRHTCLEDLWGPTANTIREQLGELPTAEERVSFLECVLLGRLPPMKALHPAVAEALHLLRQGAAVRSIVADSGYSHRRLIALFEEAVGITPKRYGRVLRFAQVLAQLKRCPQASLAQLAIAAGYSDQQHLNRDFRELAGVSPTRYLGAAPHESHHVPILACPHVAP